MPQPRPPGKIQTEALPEIYISGNRVDQELRIDKPPAEGNPDGSASNKEMLTQVCRFILRLMLQNHL